MYFRIVTNVLRTFSFFSRIQGISPETTICSAKSETAYLERRVRKTFHTDETKSPWRVLFFGTDEFSVESLRSLFMELQCGEVLCGLEVVTTRKAKDGPVRKYALNAGLKVHDWPIEVNKGEFDVGLVASFGHMIPERVISAFPLGMLNVHASLLPRWRGAAPIIYALMHGDTETGVTIMTIEPRRFDVGKIVKQEKCKISQHDTAPQLKQRLAKLGSELLIDCVRLLPKCLDSSLPQPETGITYAPKVTPCLSVVNWKQSEASDVYNLHRALACVHPLTTSWHGTTVKLHEAVYPMPEFPPSSVPSETAQPGHVVLHRPGKLLCVKCCEGWVAFQRVGVTGKKNMTALDFYNGYVSKLKKDCEHYFESEAVR